MPLTPPARMPSAPFPRRPHRRRRVRHLGSCACALAALTALAVPRVGAAQTPAPPRVAGNLALQQLEPSPAGDALFGVPSPSASGHLVPRALLMFDYARNPLQLFAPDSAAVVSSQGFLRLDASLALWDRVLISLDMPLAVVQAGEDPDSAEVSFHPPSSAALGDLRLGARWRWLGAERAPFQAALGAYVFLPTGSPDAYAGEGAVRVAPHLIVGGEVTAPVDLVWTMMAGAVLRGSENPNTFTFGGGVAVALADGLLRIGPELYGAIPFNGEPMLSVPEANISVRSGGVNAEALLGARVRLPGGVELGAAGGPGLTEAIGTPTFRVLALAAWSPVSAGEPVSASAQHAPRDRDGDGIADVADACPDARGVASDDRGRHGCPKADRDGDGVLDVADACPAAAGSSSLDPTKNGCPPDRDGDGIADAADACPDIVGAASEQRGSNGCPPDRDGDGVLDRVDACPALAGESSPDRARNGCPEDVDGDGIKPPEDACPRDRGERDPDPQQNGCPRGVRIYGKEIALLRPIRFVMYGRERHETAEPVPDEVLTAVRDLLEQRPEIKRVEVRGHADQEGDPEFNMRIAQERAESVRLWLIEAGVPKEKLVAKSYGDSDPIASNRTQEGREKNRRVQLFILEESP
ncbi:OmpA family protein [Sorangium sp. So ce1014]|uniref:OmpA family protein n=1 Tax=Sorangium sp. So ce1014 TaxID=3133326 RepID=UPI003F647D8E